VGASSSSVLGNGTRKLMMFCWRVVDNVNDRPVENPKRRFDKYSSKFFLSYKTKVINPVGKSQTMEGGAC
jgi:hypothetical protein